MSESLTRGVGENVSGISAHAHPAILRIWQKAHDEIDIDISISVIVAPQPTCEIIDHWYGYLIKLYRNDTLSAT